MREKVNKEEYNIVDWRFFLWSRMDKELFKVIKKERNGWGVGLNKTFEEVKR